MRTTTWRKCVAVSLTWALVISGTPTMAQVIETPVVPLELPVEIETELAPGSLKQAPLWHEVAQLLDTPYAITCPGGGTECVTNAAFPRRQSFIYRNAGNPCAPGSAGCNLQPMPPLNVWSPCFNVLTGQPLRLRVSDGEISWDQPGLLFGPDDGDPTTPVSEVIGNLVVDDENNLVVADRAEGADLPENGTVIAEPACTDGMIVEDGEVVTQFDKPISELDFFRPRTLIELLLVPAARRPYVGRRAAEVLGKAVFWDMQVGSDGVQACASCHFHAGVDNRTKNQLNPNHLGGDLGLEVRGPNEDLQASDYPFHKLVDLDGPGDPESGNVSSDANDVMSSMGVRFRQFADIRAIGAASFGASHNNLPSGIRPLLPDLSTELAGGPATLDPIPVFQGVRRVEPRNTPTIFGTAFNFDSFWDGRARHDANGGSVFGPADPQFHVFIDPGLLGGLLDGNLQGTSNGHIRPDLNDDHDPDTDGVQPDPTAAQPVRARFSSLASLATGPALSDFEMSFAGRNWAKIGKKLLQGYSTPFNRTDDVTPLANQLVSPTDSLLGPFSNQPGHPNPVCTNGNLGLRAANRPGLCITYTDLIQLAFRRELWHNPVLPAFLGGRYLQGASAVCTAPALNGVLTPSTCDPFDGYKLTMTNGIPSPTNRTQFRQIEANFSLFFGLSTQAWQQILIPDDTPFDRFMDANPRAANGVGQPGEQGTLPPNTIRQLVTGSPTGSLNMVSGFGPDELFGFDIFSGANLTAVLPVGSARNPAGVGSNPFLRTGRCMLCHLGPEQTDHTNNVNAGLLLSDTEFELPPPGEPEPTGSFRLVTGIPLAEEVGENAQDGVEVENRNFSLTDASLGDYGEQFFPFAAQLALPNGIAFQDNGVYNIGVRPTSEDVMRGGPDAFGWPLSLAAMAMKNLGGADYEPSDGGDAGVIVAEEAADCEEDESPSCVNGSGLFEPSGADQRINPGLEMEPANPRLPAYMAPWANNLPAGELHPEIDELAFAPNTVTQPPFAEFAEILFGADTNCGVYDPGQFGNQAPNFGWGPSCPNSQSATTNNFAPPANGTWPFPNRVARQGAVKAPQLRNVELTGPYFHTGSYLTLRQVVDFYIRGGDFPITNAQDRDPNLVNLTEQVFGFGSTAAIAAVPGIVLDGVPDVITEYGSMPDTGNATPEPVTSTPEQAKVALVKFLLALTDTRVKFERAPFDHPEIFVPLDGTAPDNGALAGAVPAGRPGFLNNLGLMFRQVPAVGAGGNATPLPGFLGVTNNPSADCSTEISHFCR